MAENIDEHFIPAFSIEDVLLDKDTGQPMSGGIVTFERSSQPGVLKNVWQVTNTNGNYTFTQLPNPMILSAIGTFVDALDNPVVPYFLPFDSSGNADYYSVTVTNAGLVPQFVRDPVPYIPDDLINPFEQTLNFTNALSNPQFAAVLFDTFDSNYVYTITGASNQTIPLAPNWDMVVTGTGTVTVSQTTPTGSQNIPTNPGTLLNITSSGITLLTLRQTLRGSPNIFGSGFVNGGFVAKTFSGAATTLTMLYSQSNGLVVNQNILTAILPGTNVYTQFSDANAVIFPASTSPDTFPDAYVNIDITIPVGTNIEITSVQVVPTGTESIDTVPYDEETNDRQIDYLFHYYQPQINFKPIPSLLTGWDFPLNPAQINGSSVTMTTSALYIWDQTIGQSYQGNIAIVRNSVTGGFQATTANNNEAFYLMQYLSGGQAKKILDTSLSVNINAYRTQAGTDVTVKVYLYRASSAAVFPILSLTPGGLNPLASDGTFTINTTPSQGQNWSLINRGFFGTATGTLSVVNTSSYDTLNNINDLQFSGWEITDATQIADTDKFAIVVTFECPTTGTVVVVDSISVVPGDIPTRPAPQSRDEVQRECEFYYETSTNTGSPISGTVTDAGALIRTQAAFTNSVAMQIQFWPRTFGIQFRTVKRTASAITTIYPETGNTSFIGNVTGYVYTNGLQNSTNNIPITNWTAAGGGNKGVQYISNYTNTTTGLIGAATVSGTANNTTDAFISFHYAVNAQLGIVA